MIVLLREELERARQRERDALEREHDYREQIARLAHMLEQAQAQSQRLLEAPRPAPVTPTTPAVATPALPAGDPA